MRVLGCKAKGGTFVLSPVTTLLQPMHHHYKDCGISLERQIFAGEWVNKWVSEVDR